MSDKAILSDIAHSTTSGADSSPKQRDKAPPKTHHAPVIRADLDPRSRPPRRPRRSAVPRRCGGARGPRRTSAKPWKRTAFPPPAPVPAWARASGRAGRAIRCSAAGAGLALLDACSAPRPARRRGAALAPRAAERRGLRQDPAPQRRRSRAARPALRRRRRRSGPRRSCFSCGATSPAGRPASTPAGFAAAAARLDLAVGPERPRSEPEGLRRGGRSGLGGRQGRRPGVFRLPGRPSGRSRNPRPLGVRHGHRHPAALAAARAADRDENPGPKSEVGRGRAAAEARRPRLAERRRRRDRARRRLRPRPRRRSFPPLRNSDRRRAQTARRNRPRKSSTSCSPKIASRPPKRPATRR